MVPKVQQGGFNSPCFTGSVHSAAGIDHTVKHTFETWSDFWFEHHKDNITPTTQQNYKYILKTLQDRIGPRRLLDIKAFDIEVLLALEPKYIENDGSVIYIRQAVVQIKGTVTIGPPKSRDNYRDIPVPPSLRDCALFLRNTKNRFVWEVGKKRRTLQSFLFPGQVQRGSGKRRGGKGAGPIAVGTPTYLRCKLWAWICLRSRALWDTPIST